MGINHCCAHIAVTEMFLYGADVVVWFWQVSWKGMAESVAAGVFVDSDFENGGFYCTLHKGFVYVPASFLTCQFVLPAVFLRKVPLPFEFLAAWRIFWVKGIGKDYGSESFWWIFLTSSICFFRFYLTDYMCLIQDACPGIFFWIAIQALLFILNGNFIFLSQERLFFLKKQP